MRTRRRRWATMVRVAAAAAALATPVLRGGGPAAGAGLPQLTGTGSSFAGVAISDWTSQFYVLDGGNINFTVSNSILGMNEFCNKTVDFGATDISYSTNQSVCSTDQVPYPFQYMPDVAGGLAFEYNLIGQNGQQIRNLNLDAATIEGIFTGAISNWDNSAIQQLNPQVRLPNERITPYYRSDPCGENYLLSDYLLHTDPGPVTTFQSVATVPTPAGQPSATWAGFSNGVPTSSQFPNIAGLVGANGADAVSQGPLHAEGGISYVETAYAKNVGLPVASVVNQAGNAVQPTSYNVATALTKAILYSDLTQNLGYVYTNPDPDAYPISAYSYLLAQCVPAAAAQQNFSCDSTGSVTMGSQQGAELAKFITYVACLGQSKMAELGYSPLPPNLVEDDFQAAGRLPGGSTPPAPTASNCQNPYITGQLQPVGQPTVVSSGNPGGSDVTTGSSGPTSAGSGGGPGASTAAAGGGGVAGVGGTGGAATSGGGSAAGGGGGTSGTATGASVSGGQGSGVAAGGRGAGEGQGTGSGSSGLQGSYSHADKLQTVAADALRRWSPTGLVLWSAIFAVAVVGFPLGGWLAQRRRRRDAATGGPP